MSILTPFLRRREVTPPQEETYIEVQERMPVVVAPQLPPEAPIPSLFNTRAAKMPKVFFFHPAVVQEDRFLYRGATIASGANIPPGAMGAWGHRFNVKRPVPETYGSQFELGGDR